MISQQRCEDAQRYGDRQQESKSLTEISLDAV